jgi:hypothetical protein
VRHDPVERLNDHHSDDLLAVARAFGDHPEATAARAQRVDQYGIDLAVVTPNGTVSARVTFTEPVTDAKPPAIRRAFADLTRRARATLEARDNQSNTR